MKILLFYDNFVRDYCGLLLLSEILKGYSHEVLLCPLWDDAIKRIDEENPDIVVMGHAAEYTTSVIADHILKRGIKLVLNSTETGPSEKQMKNLFKYNFKESNEDFIDFQVLTNNSENDYVLNSDEIQKKYKYKWFGFPRYDFHLNESLLNVERDIIISKYKLDQYNRKFLYISSFIYDGTGEQVSPENHDDMNPAFKEKLDFIERKFTEDILFKLVENFKETNDVLMIKKHPWEKSDIWEERIRGKDNIIILDNNERISPVLSITDYMMHLRSIASMDAWCQGVKTISIFPDNEESRSLFFHHLNFEVVVSDYDGLVDAIDNYPQSVPGKEYLDKYLEPYLDGKATIRLAKEINRLKPGNAFQGAVKSNNVEKVYDLTGVDRNSYTYHFMLWETKRKEVDSLYIPAIHSYIKENISEFSDGEYKQDTNYNEILLNQEGENLFLKGDRPGAKEIFSKVIELNNCFDPALNNLGVIFLEEGDMEKALQYFKNALEINPFNRDTVINISSILISRGELNTAEKLILNYLTRNPKDMEISDLLGDHCSDAKSIAGPESNYVTGDIQQIAANHDLSNLRMTAQQSRFGKWQVKIAGLSIYCHDLLSFYMAAKDIFLHGIYDFETQKRQPVIIDGGGHIGLFTLYAKQKYPDSIITVFEPDDESLDLLRNNIEINKIENVKIVNAGLYFHEGEVSFGSDHSDGSSIYAKEKETTVRVVPLSKYIESEIDFLKLNIEGAELDVLHEIESKLQLVKELVIEYHGFPEIGQKLHEILAILDRNGFRYSIHDFDGETNSATKPPFRLEKETRFFLLIYAKRIFDPVRLQTSERINDKHSNSNIQLKETGTAVTQDQKKEEIEWLVKSRTDPNGRLFRQEGRLFRAMNKYDRTFYNNLIDIVNSNEVLSDSIIKSTITDKVIKGYKCVLEHEEINPATGPYNWTYHMFKDAVLMHINAHIELLENGYTLQDAHPWNILFRHTSPVFVDYGSIIPANNDFDSLKKEYYHFCVLPLTLMALGEFERARRYLTHSIPHLTDEDIYGRLVMNQDSPAAQGYLKFTELMDAGTDSNESFLYFLKGTGYIINELYHLGQESTWSIYHEAEEGGQKHNKIEELEKLFREKNNCTVLDIGCAAGFYSIMAAKSGLDVVATDVDQPGLDYTYLAAKEQNLKITPVLRNVLSNNDDFDGNRFDIVIAVALIHHLAFTQKMSFDEITEKLLKYCNKHLVIEYMNDNDNFVKEHIDSYQFDYSLESLQESLSRYFTIDRIADSTSDNRKLLFCTVNRNNISEEQINDSSLALQPVSRKFGFDRGTPIDRYYIEGFLDRNSHLIRGRVLEIGDNAYTIKYGTGVEHSDVLNSVPSQNATIVGDLATGENIPENLFDCIIMTQTIQCIYDVKSALQNAVRALKPGGTLLITAPSISQISRYDMDRWGDYWRFTDKSLKKIISEIVPEEAIQVESFGNVAVAKAFLDGLSLEELGKDVLDYNDKDYQVILTSAVRKPELKQSDDIEPSNESIKNELLKSPTVLLYHRVDDDPIDSQLLAVSPENFEAHIQELTSNYRVLPLWELLKEASEGILRPDTVALTFDDGYLDVLSNAVPLLEKYGVHATVFITSGMVGSVYEFWWDALERIFLTGHPLPDELEMTVSDEIKKWDLVDARQRLRAYDDIANLLRTNSYEEISIFINNLLEWAGMDREGRISHRVVNHEQLSQLSSSPLIEIGSHTVNHVWLSALSPDEQREEIIKSKEQLEQFIEKPVRLFSYPFGSINSFNDESMRIVSDTGYVAGIANIQGSITASTDIYSVPRVLVRNWSGGVFTDWLRAEDKTRLEQETLSQRDENLINYQTKFNLTPKTKLPV